MAHLRYSGIRYIFSFGKGNPGNPSNPDNPDNGIRNPLEIWNPGSKEWNSESKEENSEPKKWSPESKERKYKGVEPEIQIPSGFLPFMMQIVNSICLQNP